MGWDSKKWPMVFLNKETSKKKNRETVQELKGKDVNVLSMAFEETRAEVQKAILGQRADK
jgi:hypothetical protein